MLFDLFTVSTHKLTLNKYTFHSHLPNISTKAVDVNQIVILSYGMHHVFPQVIVLMCM